MTREELVYGTTANLLGSGVLPGSREEVEADPLEVDLNNEWKAVLAARPRAGVLELG